MRVIAGKFKGHILKMPKAVKIRPTSQKVKQALFNIIESNLSRASFLELFAGSGSVGIEAKSRGAAEIVFVENMPKCIKTIAANLRQLGIAHSYGVKGPSHNESWCATILPLEAEKAIELLEQNEQKFNFIFLDPPYRGDKLKNCLIKLSQYDILKPRSYVIAEHYKDESLPQEFGRLKLSLSKTYGDTSLSFYQKRE